MRRHFAFTLHVITVHICFFFLCFLFIVFSFRNPDFLFSSVCIKIRKDLSTENITLICFLWFSGIRARSGRSVSKFVYVRRKDGQDVFVFCLPKVMSFLTWKPRFKIVSARNKKMTDCPSGFHSFISQSYIYVFSAHLCISVFACLGSLNCTEHFRVLVVSVLYKEGISYHRTIYVCREKRLTKWLACTLKKWWVYLQLRCYFYQVGGCRASLSRLLATGMKHSIDLCDNVCTSLAYVVFPPPHSCDIFRCVTVLYCRRDVRFNIQEKAFSQALLFLYTLMGERVCLTFHSSHYGTHATFLGVGFIVGW